MIKKSMSFVALLVVAAMGLTACGSDSDSDAGTSGTSGTFKVGWAEFAPYFHLDPATNKVTGLNVDITDQAATGMDMKVEYVQDAWPTLMLGLNSNKYDAAFVAFTEERAKQGDFSDFVYQTDYTFAVPAGSSATGIADLDVKDKTIAVTTGSSTDSILTATVKNAKILRVRDVGSALLAIKNGQADAMATTRDYIAEVAKKDPKIAVLDSKFAVSQFGFAVKKGNTELLTKLNGQIVKAKADGSITKTIADDGLIGVTVSE
jgi:polar amino acid transport system substrate-binding protein